MEKKNPEKSMDTKAIFIFAIITISTMKKKTNFCRMKEKFSPNTTPSFFIYH